MGLFDKVTDLAKENGGKVADLAKEHGDKLQQGIEKVGEVIDEKTGGKFSEKIDQAENLAKDQLGKLSGE